MTPPTSKVDNKVQEQRAKKKDENTEKDLDNSEEKSPKAIQTQEKTGPVFDELGGNFIYCNKSNFVVSNIAIIVSILGSQE